MTASEYKQNGFLLSTLMDQTIINRAETEVIDAYISPICPELNPLSPLYKKAVMTLAFMLMCKRDGVFLTRSGAKEKENQFSSKSEAWDNLQALATDCHFIIEELRRQENANKDAKITDICGIYFKTNFYHI